MVEMTAIQDQMRQHEGVARERGVARDPGLDLCAIAERARQPGDRQMRQIRTPFRGNTDADERVIDLAVECRERRGGLDAGPERVDPPAFLERADARDRDRRRIGMDLRQHVRDVFGDRALDLADEAQRHVELFVVLPARARDAVHDVEEAVADGTGRTQGDEQAYHDPADATPRRGAKEPRRLKNVEQGTIFAVTGVMPDRGVIFTMANWSDPRPGAASFGTTASTDRSSSYDAGLRSYMLSVYNYMGSGVLLTGIVALLFSWGGATSPAAQVFMGGGPLKYVIMFAPLAIVFGMSFGQNRMSTATLQMLFWGFAVLMGLSLSTIFLVYSGTSIAGAFFATAAGFAGLSLYGYTTKRDLSAFGTFLIIGIVGLIVASLINLFLQSGIMQLVISGVGVLLFAGLTAYDTQRTKSLYMQVAGTDMVGKVVIMSALSLYLDFINMFMFVLRLFGSSRN